MAALRSCTRVVVEDELLAGLVGVARCFLALVDFVRGALFMAVVLF